MIKFFNRSILSKKEQREVELIKKDGKGKIIFSVILYSLVFLSFSFNFQIKLLNILSSTSMLDQSDELSTFDRIFIKRKADALYENYGLAFRFLIANSALTLPQDNPDAFFIGIENNTTNSITYLPEYYENFQAIVDYKLRLCLQDQIQNKDYALCIKESLDTLNKNMQEAQIRRDYSRSLNLF